MNIASMRKKIADLKAAVAHLGGRSHVHILSIAGKPGAWARCGNEEREFSSLELAEHHFEQRGYAANRRFEYILPGTEIFESMKDFIRHGGRESETL